MRKKISGLNQEKDGLRQSRMMRFLTSAASYKLAHLIAFTSAASYKLAHLIALSVC
jgi:hypothetical protein